MSGDLRYCPLCQDRTAETVCPKDRVPTVAAKFLDASPGLAPGTLIAGRYRIERKIGEGGMGAVMLATQLGMDRKVALKTLSKSFVNDPDGMARFYREARAASQLEHPNVVRVFDFGVDDAGGTPFLVMEYLSGDQLSDVIHRERSLGERRACALLAQVAKALIEAHGVGIVHRDLKPDNIHVKRLPDGEEHVKVLDFGIAKLASGDTDPSRLTRTGHTVGTPAYMSPEQIQGKSVDFRSDLYALGCILHHMLAGREPFQGDEPSGVFVAHLLKQPPPLPDVLIDGRPPSDGLRNLCRALLAKAAAARPSSTADVARALVALGQGSGDLPAFVSPPSEPVLVAMPITRDYVAPDNRSALDETGDARALNVAETVEPIEALPHQSPQAAPAPVPTGSSADLVIRPAAPTSRKLALAAALAGVAVMGVIVWLASDPDHAPTTAPEPAPVAAAAATTPVPPRVVMAPALPREVREADTEQRHAARPMEPTATLPPPEPPPAIASREVTVVAVPKSAEVRQGDQILGPTPRPVTVPNDAKVELMLLAPGFLPTPVTLDATSDAEVKVRLRRKARKVDESGKVPVW